jgi:ankyrin repeat protein/WD40 repeat protein
MNLVLKPNKVTRERLKPNPSENHIRPLAVILVSLLACISVLLSAQQVPGHTTLSRQPRPGRPQPVIQQGHSAEVEAMTFSPDNALLATAAQDGAVRMWDLRTGNQLYGYPEDASWPMSLAIAPDGKTLATFMKFGKLSLRDLATGRLLRTLYNGSDASTLAFSPDGTTLALSGQDAGISLWNYRTGQRLRSMKTHVDESGEVAILAFSPDGSRLACAGGDWTGYGTVEIWNVVDGSLAAYLTSQSVHSLAFSPDGKTLAVGIGQRLQLKPAVELWDLAQRKVIKRFPAKEFALISLAFSRDGGQLAAGDGQGLLTVWDVATGTVRRKLGVEDFVVQSTVSPGARMGAEADHAGSVRVYELSSGKLLRLLSGDATPRAHHADEEALHHRLVAAMAQTQPTKGPAKQPDTPTDALKATLTSGTLGNPKVQERIEARIKALLAAGADPNLADADGNAPILYATDPFLMKELLLKGADPNVRNRDGTPVIIACGKTELTRLLLDHGANVNATDKQGETALMSAAGAGKFDLAKLLLERGADPDHAAEDGDTALMCAIFSGNLLITNDLLAKRAKVNVEDRRGWTPLTHAVNRQDATVVQLLINKGADVHVRTADKQTLLQLIKQRDANDAFGVAKLLKQAGEQE